LCAAVIDWQGRGLLLLLLLLFYLLAFSVVKGRGANITHPHRGARHPLVRADGLAEGAHFAPSTHSLAVCSNFRRNAETEKRKSND